MGKHSMARAVLASTVALLLVMWSAAAFAQTDEIQVYDAEIAEPGVFNLEVHNNFTPDGLKEPRFPGGLVPNGTLNGVPEWAYGVTEWFEQGLYLPLYSVSSNDGPVLNGFKVRELFVMPHAADQPFFGAKIHHALFGVERQQPLHLGHDFRADAVAGKEEEIIGRHEVGLALIECGPKC